MRRWIVAALERLCSLADAAGLDTRCRLADLSARLDERWGTGVWTEPDGVDHAR